MDTSARTPQISAGRRPRASQQASALMRGGLHARADRSPPGYWIEPVTDAPQLPSGSARRLCAVMPSPDCTSPFGRPRPGREIPVYFGPRRDQKKITRAQPSLGSTQVRVSIDAHFESQFLLARGPLARAVAESQGATNGGVLRSSAQRMARACRRSLWEFDRILGRFAISASRLYAPLGPACRCRRGCCIPQVTDAP